VTQTVTRRSLAADQRTSWLPPLPVIGAKFLELRKRRTLMIVTVLFTLALPVVFYGIRLISHLADPAHYAPAGAPNAFATAVTVMDEFGFIVAITLGVTAGTADLTDGMFRHLVITGRSRLALYLARIPAGLSILLILAAVGFTVACLVTAFLGSPLPAGAIVPSPGAMTDAGLWLELDLVIGFTVGLGLGSLMGQRTVPVILLIVLEIIITPIMINHALPGFINGQRLLVGVAMDQLKPAVLAGGSRVGPGGSNALNLPPMPTWAMITVIAGWIAGWSAIGAWRMATRDT
jgi:ABC-type transport system involved in multi-copper enzyme maturation permease subunit